MTDETKNNDNVDTDAEIFAFMSMLLSVTTACNDYIQSQMPDAAERIDTVCAEVLKQTENSKDPQIILVREQLQLACIKDYSSTSNPEADKIDAIRKVVDIVELDNAALGMQGHINTKNKYRIVS